MLSLALSLLISTAAAPDATTTQRTDSATEAPAKEKLVCRRDPNTGTRLAKRICKTQEEWNREADTVSQRLNDNKGN
ncbi:hypothetical protein [Sphingopyxis sp.]|uniref:hypothetical protein n=1 Tax=Sphingopyxis sp. TaxID=1908224 RepID=UPI003D12B216